MQPSGQSTTVKSRYPFVYVEWLDAEHQGEWLDIVDVFKHEIVICLSCGWLVHENDARLVLACSLNESASQVGNLQYIPSNMVRNRQVLWEPNGG